uniref:Uncharacterized protein n=1 Tax=Coturnix japonica TaxID=93934 RepID=A0A8C2UB20_COTJA
MCRGGICAWGNRSWKGAHRRLLKLVSIRFINYTKSAIKGIAEQLDATSRMAWENRIALDTMLAEKGCVCVMLGTHCCTFIPSNTAPDVTITKHCWGLLPLPVNWQKIQE